MGSVASRAASFRKGAVQAESAQFPFQAGMTVETEPFFRGAQQFRIRGIVGLVTDQALLVDNRLVGKWLVVCGLLLVAVAAERLPLFFQQGGPERAVAAVAGKTVAAFSRPVDTATGGRRVGVVTGGADFSGRSGHQGRRSAGVRSMTCRTSAVHIRCVLRLAIFTITGQGMTCQTGTIGIMNSRYTTSGGWRSVTGPAVSCRNRLMNH